MVLTLCPAVPQVQCLLIHSTSYLLLLSKFLILTDPRKLARHSLYLQHLIVNKAAPGRLEFQSQNSFPSLLGMSWDLLGCQSSSGYTPTPPGLLFKDLPVTSRKMELETEMFTDLQNVAQI